MGELVEAALAPRGVRAMPQLALREPFQKPERRRDTSESPIVRESNSEGASSVMACLRASISSSNAGPAAAGPSSLSSSLYRRGRAPRIKNIPRHPALKIQG
jgi:hypothetical protein